MSDETRGAAGHDLPLLLRRLHDELARAPALDPESRRMLDVVLADVRRLEAAKGLDAGSASPRGATEPPGGLETLAVRFEAEHPSLAAGLRQIADVLGKAGI